MKNFKSKNIFNQSPHKLFIIILIVIVYPICCASFYAAFVLLILPTSPLIVKAKLWMFLYWIIVAVVWIILLAVCLPCITQSKSGKSNSTKRNVRQVTDTGSSVELNKINEKKDVEYGAITPSVQKGDHFIEKKKENVKFMENVIDLKIKSADSYEDDSIVHMMNDENTCDEMNENVLTDFVNGEDAKESKNKKEVKQIDTNSVIIEDKVALAIEGTEDCSIECSSMMSIETLPQKDNASIYECSLPTPATPLQNNTVFLFINRDNE